MEKLELNEWGRFRILLSRAGYNSVPEIYKDLLSKYGGKRIKMNFIPVINRTVEGKQKISSNAKLSLEFLVEYSPEIREVIDYLTTPFEERNKKYSFYMEVRD